MVTKEKAYIGPIFAVFEWKIQPLAISIRLKLFKIAETSKRNLETKNKLCVINTNFLFENCAKTTFVFGIIVSLITSTLNYRHQSTLALKIFLAKAFINVVRLLMAFPAAVSYGIDDWRVKPMIHQIHQLATPVFETFGFFDFICFFS